MSDDQGLRHHVMEELAWEPSLDAAHIAVSASNGVVTLRGHVGSYAEKLAAALAAKRVKGVRAIAQEIEVRLPYGNKTADDEIAQRAARLVEWNMSLPEGRVQSRVEKGWIVLTGEVEWQYQKDAAETGLEKLSGVLGVTNQITVRPTVAPADIRVKIESAFRRNADLELEGISVRTDGGTVILEGTVHAWYERDMAERAAWSAPGVAKVEDLIRLG